MRWADTHVHWDAAEFDSDRDASLIRAKESGVDCCFNPTVGRSGFETVRTLALVSQTRRDWPLILPAYGIHPLYIKHSADADLEVLDQYLTMYRPIAVGEIGLDGYPGAPDMSGQRLWFEAQLELAAKHRLPVLLHVRHAVEEVIHALKRVQGRNQKIPGGIAHAFNGSKSQAQQLMRMGFYLGFGGSMTYAGSTRIRRLAAQLPLNQIVLETDSPDMAPAWLRNARNEPAQLPQIATILAELRSISIDAVAEQTTANAQQLMACASASAANGARAHSL
jgi:TatD DNase family protein